ncbi:response regulator transcription factor [Paenibacillus flagellatus]|uniref:DNA-binding response regulator n=1 Tax=Paenibacillus flagellatus TaxID=2211139 RepID=A0A2V5K190_9BACL|nr:response regulator [Paenibacillus flagellatus]PYI52861.1 DNA-binding response regulator [Paenibacillus flagellatus]
MNRTCSIMIVDDESLTRNGLFRTLTRWAKGQCDIIVAEDGLEAWERLRERKDGCDLLITDIRMPRMDGLELIRKLREAGDGVAAILLTGHAEFEYARTAVSLGAISYLLKPIDESRLIGEVEEGLRRAEELRLGTTRRKRMEAYPELFGGGRNEIANPLIREAVRYAEERLAEPLTAKDAAQAVHLNVSYFSVLFKREAGMPFTEFVTRRRMLEAKRLLLDTDMKIYEIAERTGYQSASYFVKLFQEQEGMTPKEFRDTYR